MKKVLIFGGIAFVLIVISYFGYKAYKAKQVPVSSGGSTTTPTATSTTPSAGKPVVLHSLSNQTITQQSTTTRG